jgi:phospholipase/carboxylesterase
MPTLDYIQWGPASKAEPRQIVVLCHGLGADAYDLIDLGHAWAHACPDAIFLSVHAPYPHDSGFGRQWWSVADRTSSVIQMGAEAASGCLNEFLDSQPDLPIALVGFSQGAMIALYTGLRRDRPVRAILAYSGALLTTEFRNRTPVLLVHGEADAVVPVARSRSAEAELRAAGIPVEAHYIPGLGHGLDDTAISLGALALQRAFS